VSAASLADLIREFYLERVALLMRHEDVAVTVTDYDINNAYQYIIAREQTAGNHPVRVRQRRRRRLIVRHRA